MMAKMMQTSSSGPWSAWLGPAHSCCAFFAPGISSFLEVEASEHADSNARSFLRHVSSKPDNQMSLISGWDEGAARASIAEEVSLAADGRPDWVPAHWVLKDGATPEF